MLEQFSKDEPPSTAHRRGTLPSPTAAAAKEEGADAVAMELMLRAARVPRGAAASLLEAPRRGNSQMLPCFLRMLYYVDVAHHSFSYPLCNSAIRIHKHKFISLIVIC